MPGTARRRIAVGVAVTMSAAVLVAGLRIFGERPDVRYRSMALHLGWFAGLAALSLGGTAVALLRPQRTRWHLGYLVLAVAATAAVGIFRLGFHATDLWGNARCLGVGIEVALVPLAASLVVLRADGALASKAQSSPALLGAALGSAAGLLGIALLHVHCSLADADHFALFHGGVLALAAATGAGLAWRLSRPA